MLPKEGMLLENGKEACGGDFEVSALCVTDRVVRKMIGDDATTLPSLLSLARVYGVAQSTVLGEGGASLL